MKIPNPVTRRLLLTSFALLLGALLATGADLVDRLRAAPAAVVLTNGAKADPTALKIERVWRGAVCGSRLRNAGPTPVRVARIHLFDLAHGLSGDTAFYAESFQMLAQNGGTLAQPEDWGSYSDRDHYKLDEPEGLRTTHGLMRLRPADGDPALLGFSSCRRFDGRISFDKERLLVSLDCEGLELAPGETWELEDFFAKAGPDREALLDELCVCIEKNHPRRKGFRAPSMGWCSWYCFGPEVTVPDIHRNLDWISTNAPQLRYIQIDDGYQPWMGDWLETGKSFGGDLKAVLREIQQRGFEPALWVAPFIASPESKLFREHPDWFVQGADGQPLRSDRVGFGGWRLGPWYALDGTHPEAQRFLENVFRAMRREWGCTYFKLDANYWGALHQGRFHDPKATRIEAYRRGMEAVLRGAGDAFVLGCNHPLWPSLGLLDGSRSSMDTSRDWKSIRDIGRQNLLRGWQNGRLWWNDPDCVLLGPGRVMDAGGNATAATALPENEVRFHAMTVHASGGMLLSGDDLPALKPEGVAMLRKLIPPTGSAARFADETLTVGRAPHGQGEYIYLFNWGDQPTGRVVTLSGKVRLQDFWTGESLGEHAGEYRVPELPPHSARLLEATPAVRGVKP